MRKRVSGQEWAPSGLRGSAFLLAAAVLALAVTDPLNLIPAVPGWAARLVTVLKAVLFVGFVGLNWAASGRLLRAGFILFGAGLLANAIPSVLYGAMPYSLRSARLAGMTETQVVSGSSGHVPVSRVPLALRPLADVVPVPPLHLVASLGDVLLVAGLLLGITGVLLDRRSRRTRTTTAEYRQSS